MLLPVLRTQPLRIGFENYESLEDAFEVCVASAGAITATSASASSTGGDGVLEEDTCSIGREDRDEVRVCFCVHSIRFPLIYLISLGVHANVYIYALDAIDR